MNSNYSILQIVGFQNSGKTTLVEKVIQKATQYGLTTATIKHHGHGGTPQTEVNCKDSSRHLNAGAIVSSVEGEGVFQLRTNNWELEKTIELYSFFSIDLLIIEGYKHKNFPKVVLIRDEFDLYLLDSLPNIKCVISHFEIKSKNNDEYQIFQLSDEKQYLDYLLDQVIRKR